MKLTTMLGAAWLFLAAASPAIAQPPPVEPAAPDSTTPPVRSRATSKVRYVPEDRDRFELGAGPVKGFFPLLGSVAYRRWVARGTALDESVMLELTGSGKDQLTEGAFGAYLLLRPRLTYRESWRIRPLIEFGPAAHAVVQSASLEGLSRTLYKSELYLKTHGYLGFEAQLSHRWGILARGRISVPSHRPMDYAQAAIFLR